MAAPIPAGGAGSPEPIYAAAVPAANEMIGRPIHPELTYEEYFEIFKSYEFNGYAEGAYPFNAEIQRPVMDDFEDTDNDLDEEVKVHKKYINHFFRNDPNGAQLALKEYIEWLSSGDTLCRRGLGERWEMYFTDSVSPFIQAYLDVGAKLLPLHEFLQSINEEEDENDEYEDAAERRRDLKEDLLDDLEKEMMPKRMMENAWKRRKNAVMAFAKAKENERRQSNSRRRKTRKGQRKNRRVTRRRK
jgi:hypothetical protein